MSIHAYGDQKGMFCQNTHILHKTSHMTPWGAYVWTYPLGWWYFFEKLLICSNFNMTFLWLFKIAGVKLAHFCQNTLFCLKRHILPPGVPMYGLTPWGDGIFFRRTINMLQFHYDFCYDYSRLQGSNWHMFVKICIFCIKRHIWPPGMPMYGLTPWGDGIFFKELLICFNFVMTFVMIIQDCRGQTGTFLSKYAYFA
jgi:hypothetical protein